MSVEAVGLITMLLGFVALWRGPATGVAILVPLTLLGAAGAVLLGGSGTIQPAHLMLGFVALACAGRLDTAVLRRCLHFPREGFWLAAFTLVSLAGAVLLPRLLAQSTLINAIGSTDYGPSLMLVPLGPTSGNVTQSIYAAANLLCFLLCVAFASRPAGYRTLGRAVAVYCALNIGFAFVDLATFWTGTGFLLAPIRNADYQLHIETVVTGLKRIVGSFTETSSFAYATLGAFGFAAELCLAGLRPGMFGTLAFGSLLLLLLSTSSTAYVATPLLLLTLYAGTLLRAVRRQTTPLGLALLALVPLMVIAVVAGVVLMPAARDAVTDTLTALLFDKATSQSGLERAQWNVAALRNLWDTGGLGAGLGSVRASSFPVALLANTGLPGLVLLSGFLIRLFFFGDASGGPTVEAVRRAARTACLGLLLGATVSGAMVDLGLPFFIFAALTCARPVRAAAAAHRPATATRRALSPKPRPAPRPLVPSLPA